MQSAMGIVFAPDVRAAQELEELRGLSQTIGSMDSQLDTLEHSHQKSQERKMARNLGAVLGEGRGGSPLGTKAADLREERDAMQKLTNEHKREREELVRTAAPEFLFPTAVPTTQSLTWGRGAWAPWRGRGTCYLPDAPHPW